MTPYYERGGITIYHANCVDILLSIDTPDLGVILTDPPYGIEYESGSDGLMWWQGQPIEGDGSVEVRNRALRYRFQTPALVFGSRKVPPPPLTRMVLIWDKGPALGMGALDLPWKPSYEEIYVIGNGFKGHRDGAVIYHPPVQSMASNGRVHPTEKPVGLLTLLLGKCPPGGVLDPFMGSGTTLVAAKMLGRRAIGIEIEERYCEVAARRLQQDVLPLAVPAPSPRQLALDTPS